MKKEIVDGKPCGHPGCLNHISHPCEGCGRVSGIALDLDSGPWPTVVGEMKAQAKERARIEKEDGPQLVEFLDRIMGCKP